MRDGKGSGMGECGNESLQGCCMANGQAGEANWTCRIDESDMKHVEGFVAVERSYMKREACLSRL